MLIVQRRLDAPAPHDAVLVLPFELRQKSRLRTTVTEGEEIGLFLERGSVLLLYTDGVTEAENTALDMLGDERLQQRLNDAPERTAGRLVDAVFEMVREFAGEAPQSDDITVLAIRCAA